MFEKNTRFLLVKNTTAFWISQNTLFCLRKTTVFGILLQEPLKPELLWTLKSGWLIVRTKYFFLWRKFTYIINILWHKHCFYDRLGSAATMQFILTLISFVATSLIHLYATMSSNEDCLWSFGYGSNMDVKALESKKHVKVIGKKALFVTTCVLSSAG